MFEDDILPLFFHQWKFLSKIISDIIQEIGYLLHKLTSEKNKSLAVPFGTPGFMSRSLPLFPPLKKGWILGSEEIDTGGDSQFKKCDSVLIYIFKNIVKRNFCLTSVNEIAKVFVCLHSSFGVHMWSMALWESPFGKILLLRMEGSQRSRRP